MRIIQILPELTQGDAVGNDARAIRDALREEGYETEIRAGWVDPRLQEGEGKDLRQMPALGDEDLLIYHASTGTDLNFQLSSMGGRKVMIYHNITPSRFFRWYNNRARKNMEYGYEGIRALAGEMEYCLACSEYSRQELIRMGYRCPIDVCPILIPFHDYDSEPDPKAMAEWGPRAGRRAENWLFVGRISPNKKQEDLISAFYCYQRDYEPESRLFLIGSEIGMEMYGHRLRNYIRELGIEDKVVFPGHVPFSVILACYRLADVFVCLSEHEGFCVPLVEAMHFGVPIAARGCCAVPETLGCGGLLLDSGEPETVAAAVNRILTDTSLRSAIREGQREMLEKYSREAVKARLLACLKPYLIKEGRI